jgi:tripartite-type tricarboxylate transporter receptor subunit TctC
MRTVLKFSLLAALALGLGNSLLAHVAAAADGDDYPRRAVRLISPNAPGSANDTLLRLLTVKLGDMLGQSVYIENQAGAAGLIGTEMAKNAAPDGYTILSASTAGMSIAPHLHKRPPYDSVNDFQFVSTYAVQPNLLVVNPSLPVKTVQELIDYCKSRPGQVNMASAGPGSQSHLAGVMLMVAGNFDSLHIPYKGGGASVLSVMTGESQWTITPAPAAAGHVRSGKLRPIAHSMPKRTPLLADIPTVAETLPGFSYSAWNGLLLPKATPKPVADKIRAALLKTLAVPEIKEAIEKQGAEVITNTPEEFRELVRVEFENTGKLARASGLKVE